MNASIRSARPPTYDLATIQRLLRGGAGAIALRIMGDRWSLLILRDILLGARRFEELRRLTGAARGTLISRLNTLVSLGILYRNPYQHASTRYEYRLTDKGLGLYPVAMMLWTWESKWGGQHNLPQQLIHEGCGRAMLPQLACAHCRETIVPQQVTFAPGPGISGKLIEPARYRRREGPSGSGDASFAHAIDIVGDQWATFIIAAIFYRVRRYDEMQKALDVATNILADRLRRMVRSGVVQRVLYQQHPPRYEYQLTPKGLDLYGFTAALHNWAEKWVVGPSGPVLELHHKPCGHVLKTMLVCSECGQSFGPGEVSVGSLPRRSTARTTRAVAARR
jgi:DNA-binding HxlR family transcriptional regulator